MRVEDEFDAASLENFGYFFYVIDFVVDDRGRMIELRSIGDPQHEAHSSAIEERHVRRRLKQKRHAEHVAIKSDRAVEVFYVDEYLADLRKRRADRNRGCHILILAS